MKIAAPGYCRAAWVRYLRAQGATLAEIAAALGVTTLEAARMAARSMRRPTNGSNATRAIR
jgi:DNA-binding transcriptional regulator LsrR (DeoR family)